MDVEEARAALDMLRSIPADTLGVSSTRSDRLQDLIARYEDLLDVFTADFDRYCALVEQADAMFTRARRILEDGRVHSIDVNHIEVVHRYYLLGHTRGKIAHDMGYSINRVDQRKRECLDWLDHARDAEGYPIVPLVSE